MTFYSKIKCNSTLLSNYVSLLLDNIEYTCLLVSGDMRKRPVLWQETPLAASRCGLILQRCPTLYTRNISLNSANAHYCLLVPFIQIDYGLFALYCNLAHLYFFLKTTFFKNMIEYNWNFTGFGQLQKFQKIQINVIIGKRVITEYNFVLLECFQDCFSQMILKKEYGKKRTPETGN